MPKIVFKAQFSLPFKRQITARKAISISPVSQIKQEPFVPMSKLNIKCRMDVSCKNKNTLSNTKSFFFSTSVFSGHSFLAIIWLKGLLTGIKIRIIVLKYEYYSK